MSPSDLLRLLSIFAEPFSMLVDLILHKDEPSEEDTRRVAFELMRAVWNERARRRSLGP